MALKKKHTATLVGQGRFFCHAPFNNMLIDQQGKVRICCHNSNEFMIGKFPEQSLTEIWFGLERKSMVEDFLAGQIPDACVACVTGGIDGDSPDSKVFSSKLYGGSAFDGFPKQIEFLLSNECNLSCIMCASNKSSAFRKTDPDGPSADFNEDFFDQLTPFLDQLEFAVFSGGEPFLIPIYEKIWDYLHRKNPQAGIYVQTNGTILNERVKTHLETYDIQLGVSIDSLRAENYRQIRNGAVLEHTLENLDFFIDYSKRHRRKPTIMVTPMTLNADEIADFVEFCNHKDLILSLSILNWPYHLAVWSLHSSVLQSLITGYRSREANLSSDSRNHQVFTHFISLVSAYLETKQECESHRDDYLKKLLSLGAESKEALFSQMNDAIEDSDQRASTIKKVQILIDELAFEEKSRLPGEAFAWLIFRNKPIAFFISLLSETSDSKLKVLGKRRLDELLILVETNSFDRFGLM